VSLFANNLVFVHKLVEQLWREIARQAGDAALLDVDAARIEVTIKVVPVRKMPEHFVPPAAGVKYLRANTAARIFKSKQPKMPSKKGTIKTLWHRLMGDD
jgi:hypothetical protein